MGDRLDNLDISNARFKPLTPEQRARKQARFFAKYRKSGNIKFSCAYAGISRQTFYDWREHDEAFKAQLADAEPDVDDTLDEAAYERGVEGVPSYVVSNGHLVYEELPVIGEDGQQVVENGRPVYRRGKPIVERKYSDTLLVTLLKARMPEKYKDKQQVEVSGSVDVTGFKELLMQRLARLEENG